MLHLIKYLLFKEEYEPRKILFYCFNIDMIMDNFKIVL